MSYLPQFKLRAHAYEVIIHTLYLKHTNFYFYSALQSIPWFLNRVIKPRVKITLSGGQTGYLHLYFYEGTILQNLVPTSHFTTLDFLTVSSGT